MTAPAAIELEDLAFAYPVAGRGGFSLAVDRLRIERGERVACIGPSGSGKSTLIDLIAGIRVPDRGRVSLDGVEISALGEDQRRAHRLARIGMVFQEFELLDYLSAGDNILLPYRLGGGLTLDAQARERARRLAADTGVAHTLGRSPARLSQGERQRVAVCRALVTQPTLLLCDEGTGNLDPQTAGVTLDLLFQQADALGATLLFVTHDHGLLERFGRVIDLRELTAAGGGGAA